jgi:hypothetical protein
VVGGAAGTARWLRHWHDQRIGHHALRYSSRRDDVGHERYHAGAGAGLYKRLYLFLLQLLGTFCGTIRYYLIGGTSIPGGRGNYWGTIAGAIFLVVLSAVLQEYNISEAGRSIASDVVTLVALLLYGREKQEV